jgi:hypothetical protein
VSISPVSRSVLIPDSTINALSNAVQIVSRDDEDGNFKPAVEWANLEYQFKTWRSGIRENADGGWSQVGNQATGP